MKGDIRFQEMRLFRKRCCDGTITHCELISEWSRRLQLQKGCRNLHSSFIFWGKACISSFNRHAGGHPLGFLVVIRLAPLNHSYFDRSVPDCKSFTVSPVAHLSEFLFNLRVVFLIFLAFQSSLPSNIAVMRCCIYQKACLFRACFCVHLWNLETRKSAVFSSTLNCDT